MTGPQRRAYAGAAAKVGVAVDEYAAQRALGLFWCGGCRTWAPRMAYHADLSRHTGARRLCRSCVSAQSRARWALVRSEMVRSEMVRAEMVRDV